MWDSDCSFKDILKYVIQEGIWMLKVCVIVNVNVVEVWKKIYLKLFIILFGFEVGN